MVRELDFNTVRNVIETWENLRRQGNYEETTGRLLFQRLFERCPEAKILFGFPADADPKSPEVFKSKRFTVNAIYHIQMIDTALTLLGTDIELVTEIMQDLAHKHVRYGVKPYMFHCMSQALLETLEEQLPGEFTVQIKRCWKEAFDTLIADMIHVHKK